MLLQRKPCYSCRNKRARERNVNRFHVLIFSCDAKCIEFGNETDWKAGKSMPERCDKFDKQEVFDVED